jgi:chromosome segregation ATPase
MADYGTVALSGLASLVVGGVTALITHVVKTAREINGLDHEVNERFRHYDEALARHEVTSASVVRADKELTGLEQKVDERFKHYDQVLARCETTGTSLVQTSTDLNGLGRKVDERFRFYEREFARLETAISSPGPGQNDRQLRAELRALRRQVRATSEVREAIVRFEAEITRGIDDSKTPPPNAGEQEIIRKVLTPIAQAVRLMIARHP